MTKKHNILYCFDEIYNHQGYSSIISLLDSIEEKVNIFIIHNQDLSKNDLPEIISNHNNLNEIKIYKFNDLNYNFQNLDNNHISVATYFRMFIENYIDNEIDYITYLDADTICIKNPLKEINKTINNLENSNFILGARTEKETNKEVLDRLGMSSKYFNAGVMVINLKKWRNENLTKLLVNEMNSLREKIVHWDQDVLNSYFDGEYLEIEESLNFNSFNTSEFNQEVKIIHYIGSKKPWYLSGVFETGSEYYHKNYSKISTNRYHIVHLWKKSSLIDFFKGLATMKIVKLNNPYQFIKSFVNSFR